MNLIPDEDLKVERMNRTPLGGQYAGTPPADIEVTHLPTGIRARVVHLSQHKARGIAIRMIEAALTDPQYRGGR